MSESLVQGTRASDSDYTTNEMTALSWTSEFLKMADTDLAKLSLHILVELYRDNISQWNGANPRYKDRSIGYE